MWDLMMHTCTTVENRNHYNDVIMSVVASQITSVSIVYSTVCSSADQRKHQSSASLAFLRGIHRWPVNSPHKGSVTRVFFPFDDAIMSIKKMAWHLFSIKPLPKPIIILSLTGPKTIMANMRRLLGFQTWNASNTLKPKCHFDEIFIIGCIGSCHFDKFKCSQWEKFLQSEDISVSVYGGKWNVQVSRYTNTKEIAHWTTEIWKYIILWKGNPRPSSSCTGKYSAITKQKLLTNQLKKMVTNFISITQMVYKI